MDVYVQAEEGQLSEDSYIAVRIGEIQKQTLYDPRKVYRFPEARRFGKIDVYSRVGTCDLVWGAEQPETRVCKVLGQLGETGTTLRVSLSPKANMAGPKTKAPSTQQTSSKPVGQAKDQANSQAKKYLQEHDVEGILTGAMRALLKVMPDDAPDFLINYISSNYASKKPTSKPAVTSASVVPFREYYTKHVLPARGKAFLPAFHESTSWPSVPRDDAATQQLQASLRSFPAKTGEEFKCRPAVATWRPQDIESLRQRACEILVKACQEGTIGGAVTAAMSKATPAYMRVPSLSAALEYYHRPAVTSAISKATPAHMRVPALSAALGYYHRPAPVLVDPKASSKTSNQWCMRPSIGTWLSKPRPVQKVSRWYESGCGLREPRPWNLRPSIGTWCVGLDGKPEAEQKFDEQAFFCGISARIVNAH